MTKAMTLEEEIAVSLVWKLPKNTTITVGQIKEIAPVVARIVEYKQGNMDEGSQNAYERIKEYIQKTFPIAYAKASAECLENNCQSMPIILTTAIEKLTGNADIELYD